jgi:hypothetical protein
MDMRKILLALISLSCLFASCSGRKTTEKGPFPEYSVQGKVYDEAEIFAKYPTIIDMDSLLIVYSSTPNLAGKFITVFSPREGMKEIAAYGTRGRGPGEYLSLEINSTKGHRLFARNVNKRELIVLELLGDSGRVEIREVERLNFEINDSGFEDQAISYLDEQHFVAVSYGGPGKFFSLYDNRMNWLAPFGDGPVVEELDPFNAHTSLSGHFATHNGEFTFATAYIPKVLFYSKNGDAPQKAWEDTFYDSYYRVENNRIGFDKTQTIGVVRDLELGEKYVYILFLDVPISSSQSAANIVFVYDHKGNRVARLNLDYRIDDLCVSSDEKTLYGIAETPEYRIASFDLPAFKK